MALRDRTAWANSPKGKAARARAAAKRKAKQEEDKPIQWEFKPLLQTTSTWRANEQQH